MIRLERDPKHTSKWKRPIDFKVSWSICFRGGSSPLPLAPWKSSRSDQPTRPISIMLLVAYMPPQVQAEDQADAELTGMHDSNGN